MNKKCEGISLSKAVIRIIDEYTDTTKPQLTYHDLDSLSGKWIKAEADQIDKALSEQRAIDPWR